jgi:tetratricopeptide (TPR) repeat protein
MTPFRIVFTIGTLAGSSLALAVSAAAALAVAQDNAPGPDAKLPMCGLAPAKIHPGLCIVKYRISTNSPECQALFDQGLGFFYSYVWMEACRSFETACQRDPDCALAWWGLSRAMERYNKSGTAALQKAQALSPKASHREQLLIQAKLQEKGLVPNVGDQEARRKAAIKTIDTLLALYDDDEEGWYFRAQLDGGAGLFGGQVSSVPFYKALVRLNPLHPGANHELLHFYEKMQRPALGWLYAEKYIESSPGIPHAFHMQAHLATRLGRWDKTTDRGAKAIELERAYQLDMKVKPSEDQQYPHQLEMLMRGLIHDGRFAEARQLKKECLADNIKHPQVWFRLHMAERDFEAALGIADAERKKDKLRGSYLAALVWLNKNDVNHAVPEVAALEAAFQKNAKDNQLELRVWEVLGILLCQQGQADRGLQLLSKAVERTKADYSHHAWGNGAYHMEAWGLAALGCHRYEIAEEALLEALAHDPGCFHAALGLQVLCEKFGRGEEAVRYGELAQRCWRKAAPSDRERELQALRDEVGVPAPLPSPRRGEGSGVRGEGQRGKRFLTAFPSAQISTPTSEGAGQAQPFRSGLPLGGQPGPYAMIVVTGPQRGKSHCFICETADKPAVIIFARKPHDTLAKLASGVNKAIVTHKDVELRSWLTFLHEDQASIDDQIVQWSQRHALTNLPLAVFEDVGGPPSYRLNQDAEVTVLLMVKQRVVGNFAFRQGELNEVRVEEILKAVEKLAASGGEMKASGSSGDSKGGR